MRTKFTTTPAALSVPRYSFWISAFIGLAGSSKYLFRVTSRNRKRGDSLGIETEEADVLSLLADGHQHGLAVVERLRLGVEHIVILRCRHHDVKAGMGLGEPLGELGLSLNHQHLIITFGFELGQDARQDVFRVLDRRQERSLSGSFSFSSDSGSITAVTPSFTGPAATTRLGLKSSS